MPLDTVKYKRDGRITYITLNRPRVLNAVNIALEHALVGGASLKADAFAVIVKAAEAAKQA